MIIEDKFKEIVKTDTMEKIINLINNIEFYFSISINRFTKEELEIVCDVIYDELAKKRKLDAYYECVEQLISNSLYSSLDADIRFDFNCLKLNKLVLLNYFNYFEINHIMKTMDKKIKQEIKCKIIKFKVR